MKVFVSGRGMFKFRVILAGDATVAEIISVYDFKSSESVSKKIIRGKFSGWAHCHINDEYSVKKGVNLAKKRAIQAFKECVTAWTLREFKSNMKKMHEAIDKFDRAIADDSTEG